MSDNQNTLGITEHYKRKLAEAEATVERLERDSRRLTRENMGLQSELLKRKLTELGEPDIKSPARSYYDEISRSLQILEALIQAIEESEKNGDTDNDQNRLEAPEYYMRELAETKGQARAIIKILMNRLVKIDRRHSKAIISHLKGTSFFRDWEEFEGLLSDV